MDGWVGGWMDGWMDGKAGLRIAYSNQKEHPRFLLFNGLYPPILLMAVKK